MSYTNLTMIHVHWVHNKLGEFSIKFSSRNQFFDFKGEELHAGEGGGGDNGSYLKAMRSYFLVPDST